MNFLPATVTAKAKGALAVDIPSLGKVCLAAGHAPEGLDPASVSTIGVRPEMLTILFDDAEKAECETTGEVTATSYCGDMTYYSVLLPKADEAVTISMRNTVVAPSSRRAPRSASDGGLSRSCCRPGALPHALRNPPSPISTPADGYDLLAGYRPGFAMEQAFYASDEIFAADVEAVMMREWHFAGLATKSSAWATTCCSTCSTSP